MLRRLVCAGAIVLLITGAVGAQSNSDAQSPLSVPFKPKTHHQLKNKSIDKRLPTKPMKRPSKRYLTRSLPPIHGATFVPPGSTSNR